MTPLKPSWAPQPPSALEVSTAGSCGGTKRPTSIRLQQEEFSGGSHTLPMLFEDPTATEVSAKAVAAPGQQAAPVVSCLGGLSRRALSSGMSPVSCAVLMPPDHRAVTKLGPAQHAGGSDA